MIVFFFRDERQKIADELLMKRTDRRAAGENRSDAEKENIAVFCSDRVESGFRAETGEGFSEDVAFPEVFQYGTVSPEILFFHRYTSPENKAEVRHCFSDAEDRLSFFVFFLRRSETGQDGHSVFFLNAPEQRTFFSVSDKKSYLLLLEIKHIFSGNSNILFSEMQEQKTDGAAFSRRYGI